MIIFLGVVWLASGFYGRKLFDDYMFEKYDQDSASRLIYIFWSLMGLFSLLASILVLWIFYDFKIHIPFFSDPMFPRKK